MIVEIKSKKLYFPLKLGFDIGMVAKQDSTVYYKLFIHFRNHNNFQIIKFFVYKIKCPVLKKTFWLKHQVISYNGLRD